MKNLIKALVLLIIVGMYGTSLKAQTVSSGIYLTEQDYRSNTLSYVLSDQDKLRLNEFIDGKNINLTYQGKKITLSKSQIFGYRLNNQDFRFYQNQAYRILDTGGFLLYSREKLTQGTKGYKPVEKYFYSVDPSQPVMALTTQNLWNSFPGQTGFRYSLQSNFNNDADLIAYDKLSNQYKIKYLFMQQMHQQKQSIITHANL
jgi:hypothetical protein